jgi:hypothetical protein
MPRHGAYPHGQNKDANGPLRPGDRPEQVGNWETGEREAMNDRFVEAMIAAGYELTGSSSHFGTKTPIANYQRPD